MSYQLSPDGQILGADGQPLMDTEGNPVQLSTEGIAHIPRDQIRSMEDRAKTADDQTARAEAAERKLAFAEAGIDISDQRMAYFMKGYEGELDADKIKAEAAAAGFMAAPAGTQTTTQADEDAARAIQDAGNTAYSNPDGIPLEDAIKGAKTEGEVMQLLKDSGLPIVPEQ